MQVVIALPLAAEMERLEEPVCGIPLLRRVISAAAQAGGTDVLLVAPCEWTVLSLARRMKLAAIDSVTICVVHVPHPFNPYDKEDWRSIAASLEEQFLWSPCDYVAHRQALKDLMATAGSHPRAVLRFARSDEEGPAPRLFEQPTVVLKRDVLEGAPDECEFAVIRADPGISARSPARIGNVEAELVRHSGKATDGVYSRFNRRLCWPVLRWLSRTHITPNSVSFAGLAVAVISAAAFAQGKWLWDVAGALCFFACGLLDEIDGMLARLKFQESAFGCWLETFVDYATYLLAFSGMAIGGYRRDGSAYLCLGAAVILGSLVSFFVISVQRKLVAPTKPTEYYQRHLKALDEDSKNPVSKAVRTLQFLLRKGVVIHYILLFAIFDAVALVLFIAAVGANAAWIVTLYLNWRLYLSKTRIDRRMAHNAPAQAEVRR